MQKYPGTLISCLPRTNNGRKKSVALSKRTDCDCKKIIRYFDFKKTRVRRASAECFQHFEYLAPKKQQTLNTATKIDPSYFTIVTQSIQIQSTMTENRRAKIICETPLKLLWNFFHYIHIF